MTETFASFDGTRIVYRRMGTGRPLILLHGLFSNAETNWVRYGTAAALVAAGFELILPDFRAHGGSAAPTDPAAYPADVLARDVEALVAHLGLTGFDLGGYSLGARTCVRLLARGLRPRRVVLAGMGLQGVVGASARTAWFLRMIEDAPEGGWPRGTPEAFAAQFMRQGGIVPEAAAALLRSQVDTPADAIAAIDRPVLVACGADDRDNGSAPDLAAAIPGARYAELPGNHMSAVTKPELVAAIAAFLAD